MKPIQVKKVEKAGEGEKPLHVCSVCKRPKDLALDWKVLKFIQNFLHSEIRYLVPK